MTNPYIPSGADLASQLPVHHYFDPAILARERSHIFDRSARYVGHEKMVPNPGDWRTLTAQAKLRFSQQDWAGAQESGQSSLKIVSTPEAAMIAADSAEKLGDSEETARLRSLIFESATGAHQHGRSLALYLADHDLKPSEAVALAEAEAKTRPSIESYDALAWCLFKAGRKPEAEAAMRKALARDTRDPQLRHHAEQILGPNTLETQR